MKNKLILTSAVLPFLILLFGSISIAVVPGVSDNKDGVVGFWFGVHQQDDVEGDIQEICNTKADGTFLTRFRLVRDGRPVGEQSEAGRWYIKDNIMTTITTQINGKNLGESEYITDKYLITNLTDSEMSYENMKSGTKFRDIRVKEGFDFP